MVTVAAVVWLGYIAAVVWLGYIAAGVGVVVSLCLLAAC